MILEKHRYDMLSARDGPEGLAIFAQQMQSIHLVLNDVAMLKRRALSHKGPPYFPQVKTRILRGRAAHWQCSY
ncbi:MAG: hypothetical protein DME59_07880 [Verrucomicrobia bacterium]|nr:MAG: hypothetical protein DME59_07880 [Verrucomicrobiota bacterium]